MTPSPLLQICELTVLSARAGILRKAVLSKPLDPAVSKVTLTLRRIGKEIMLQAETLKSAVVAEVAGKGTPVQASHQNIPLDQNVSAVLDSLFQGFGQINLMNSTFYKLQGNFHK